MADLRNGTARHGGAVVAHGFRGIAVDERLHAAASARAAVGDGEIIAGHLVLDAAGLGIGNGRVEAAWIGLLAVLREFLEEIDLRCLGLVAAGHQDKRRMIAVGFQDAIELRAPPLQAGRRIRGHRGLAIGKLRLHIDAEFVCGVEGGLGQNPRMAAEMVEAEVLQQPEDLQPCGLVHRRMAGERKLRVVRLAAKQHRFAIDGETRALALELAESKTVFAFSALPAALLISTRA